MREQLVKEKEKELAKVKELTEIHGGEERWGTGGTGRQSETCANNQTVTLQGKLRRKKQRKPKGQTEKECRKQTQKNREE